MQRFLAIATALITFITAVLGLAILLGLESAERYHLAFGFLALVLVLLLTHQVYYNARR